MSKNNFEEISVQDLTLPSTHDKILLALRDGPVVGRPSLEWKALVRSQVPRPIKNSNRQVAVFS